jgi:hypothetical protein
MFFVHSLCDLVLHLLIESDPHCSQTHVWHFVLSEIWDLYIPQQNCRLLFDFDGLKAQSRMIVLC